MESSLGTSGVPSAFSGSSNILVFSLIAFIIYSKVLGIMYNVTLIL